MDLTRRAVLTHAWQERPRPPVQQTILFVLRTTPTRQIANQRQLIGAIGAESSLRGKVRFLQLGELSLLKQLELVASARGIAGVNGHSLAWVAMLPKPRDPSHEVYKAASSSKANRGAKRERREYAGCGMLELWPQAVQNSHRRRDYAMLAEVAGCKHISLVQPDAPECRGKSPRACGNVTANASAVVDALYDILRASAT